MENPGNTGDLDPHAAAHVGAFERLMERIGEWLKREPAAKEPKQSFGSHVHKNYPRIDWWRGGR